MGKSRPRPFAIPVLARYASTKHPKGFVAPNSEELTELRDRVQEFTSQSAIACVIISSDAAIGREIPEDVAAKTDRENEFPSDMWKKFGEAGSESVLLCATNWAD